MKAPICTKYQVGKKYTGEEVIKAQLNGHDYTYLQTEDIDKAATFTLKLLTIKSKKFDPNGRGTRVNCNSMKSLEMLGIIEKAYETGAELPPIIVDREGIIDGLHRYNILKGNGYTHAYAFVQNKN
jgi:hypothetical protein